MKEWKMPRVEYKGKTATVEDVYRGLADMTYKSPIEIFCGEIETKVENGIYEAVQKYDISVDKEELIKALQYDRDQYRKGFADGCIGALSDIRAEAVKEYAGRLKERLIAGGIYPALVKNQIDKLLQEMTQENQ